MRRRWREGREIRELVPEGASLGGLLTMLPKEQQCCFLSAGRGSVHVVSHLILLRPRGGGILSPISQG